MRDFSNLLLALHILKGNRQAQGFYARHTINFYFSDSSAILRFMSGSIFVDTFVVLAVALVMKRTRIFYNRPPTIFRIRPGPTLHQRCIGAVHFFQSLIFQGNCDAGGRDETGIALDPDPRGRASKPVMSPGRNNEFCASIGGAVPSGGERPVALE